MSRRAVLAGLVLAACELLAARSTATAQGAVAVGVRGQLIATTVDAGQGVSFAVTITNTSDHAIAAVNVPHVGGSHVELSHAWWCAPDQQSPPPGPASWNALRRCTVAASLDAGQSRTTFGRLITSEPIDTSVVAVVEWGASGASQVTASLGRLTVQSIWWKRWFGAFVAALPTLALPLVVFGLGAWFQRRLATLEHARQDHAEKRAEQAEIQRLMLTISHEAATKYYADLELAAGETAAAIDTARRLAGTPESPAALDEAFFEWIFLQARIRATNEESGCHFKSYMGTALVWALLDAYQMVFYYRRPARGGPPTLSPGVEEHQRRLLSRVVIHAGLRPTSDTVLTALDAERTASTGPYRDLAAWFQTCVDDAGAEPALRYLHAFRAILTFETGRLYSGWYVDKVPLRLSHDSLLTIIELCQRLRPDDALCDMAANVDGYLLEAGIGQDAIARARNEIR